MDLKEIDVLGPDIAGHWYYRSKAMAMSRLIGARRCERVLDVGAGSGFFSRHLLAQGIAGEAWCVDTSYPADADDVEAGRPIRFRRAVDILAADLVLMMDVLEHVDDDAGLLAAYAAKATTGARFLLSVPAFRFMWSEHDEFLEHRRRYTLAELEAVAQRAGLRVTRGAYYFGGVLPLAWLTRRLAAMRARSGAAAAPRSQLRRHGAIANAALASICRLELPLLLGNRAIGLTAFCVAEKP